MRQQWRNWTRLVLATSIVLLLAPPAHAEHFLVDLTVKTPQGRAESHWDSSPPVGGVNTRPMVRAKVGDRLEIEWVMRSDYPHGVMKNVGVHFFIIREAAIDQKLVPNLKSGRWTESRVVMDFLPDHAARGSLQLIARTAGAYLVRIESEGAEPNVAHEHFAALDLVVE